MELRRGDIVHSINGTPMSTSNYIDLLNETNAIYTASYRRYNDDTEQFEEQDDVAINPVLFSENPVLLDTVYEISGKKIAYLIYTFFSPSASETGNEYDQLVESVFQTFKDEGVTELIIDFRYNGGGSETSIVNLASLITNNVTTDDIIMRKTYNSQVESDIIAEPSLGEEFLTVEFDDKLQNVGSQLATNTVYFITSPGTASASEVVINAVRPFMNIHVVGKRPCVRTLVLLRSTMKTILPTPRLYSQLL